MADPVINICNQIITLMKADSSFNSLNGYVIGETFPKPPTQNYPLCEVTVTDENRVEVDTGSYTREFNGLIRFSALTQDRIVFTDSVYTVTSYTTVYGLVQSVVELLGHKWTNQTSLNGLSLDTGGVVQSFNVGDAAEYGIGERENTYEMQAVVPFACITRESRDFS